MKTKKIYIIPGFMEMGNNIGYRKVKKFLEESGYEVLFWSPEWESETISTWVKNFSKIIKEEGENKISILGFSLGAMIALLVSEKFKNIENLYLCSLSPYFYDDLKKMPEDIYGFLNEEEIIDFSKTKMPEKIENNTYIFYGSEELDITKKRSEKLYSCLKPDKKKRFIIDNVNHNFSNKIYYSAVIDEIKKTL